MKGIGDLTKLMGKGDSSMLMAMCMKDFGGKTRQMGKGYTRIWMALNMSETGKTISSMGMASRSGLTLLGMKGNMRMG